MIWSAIHNKILFGEVKFMQKHILTLLWFILIPLLHANEIVESDSYSSNSNETQKIESDSVSWIANKNDNYISNTRYIQNPYAEIVSGEGTLVPQKEVMDTENIWEKWFTNGTYNVYSGVSSSFGGSARGGRFGRTTSYGASTFAQTGQVSGFSLGGGFTVMNPFFAENINGDNTNNSLLNPGNRQIALTQAFIEYQYNNILNIDVGYISINNSPWLSTAYYNDLMGVPITYQGALINVNTGGGWILTALAFNGIQTSGQQGFSGETLYNSIYGKSYMTTNANSNGTIALGANYEAWDNNYNLRLWGYQFNNFGTLLYSDSSLKLPINKTLQLNFAAQAGINNNFGATTAYTNNTDGVPPFSGTEASYFNSSGNINSNFLGAKAGITVDWFTLTLSANTMWGPSNAVGNGTVITPYTSSLGTDPIFADGWLTSYAYAGSVGGSTGNLYKIGTSFKFLDNNLSFSPSYVTLANANPYWNGTQEAYATLNYSIPQVRGLFIFGVYSYQWTPTINPMNGKNDWAGQILTSYLW